MPAHQLTAADGIQWTFHAIRSAIAGPCLMVRLTHLSVFVSTTAEVRRSVMDDGYATLQLDFGQLEFDESQRDTLRTIVAELQQLRAGG